MLETYRQNSRFLSRQRSRKFFQKARWRMNGTAAKIQRIFNSKDYETSAQVFEIVDRYKPSRSTHNSSHDFITNHVGFESPDVVNKKSVSLYAITPKEAMFVEVPDDVDLYDCWQSPLFFLKQHENATKLIRMPLSTLHRIADDIGAPEQAVIFVHSVAAGNATMLMQILARLRAENETMCIAGTSVDHQLISDQGKYSEEDFMKLFTSTVRLLCKRPASLTVIKLGDQNSLKLAPIIKETFPDAQQLFCYHNAQPLNQAKYLRLTKQYDFKLVYFAQSCPRRAWITGVHREKVLRRFYGDKMYDKLKNRRITYFSKYRTICIHTAIQYGAYHDHNQKGVGMKGVRWEDFKTDATTALERILDKCGLQQYKDQAQEMLKARLEEPHTHNPLPEFKRDINTVDTHEIPAESLMPGEISSIDTLCKIIDLPPLSRKHPLWGTITEKPRYPPGYEPKT